MRRSIALTFVLGFALGAAAMVSIGSFSTVAGAAGARCRLAYGFVAQCDRPFYAVGDTARVTLALFNFSAQDAFGFSSQGGGFGCEYSVEVLDAAGTVVFAPAVGCTDAIVEKPLLAGTTIRANVSLPLADDASRPLPPGAYRFRVKAEFHGPNRAAGDFDGMGGSPEAVVPFRIE
jgi:hypothetical protein